MHRFKTNRRPEWIDYRLLSFLVTLQSIGSIDVYCRFGSIYRKCPATLRIVEYCSRMAQTSRMMQHESVIVAFRYLQLGMRIVNGISYQARTHEVEWCIPDIHKLTCKILMSVIYGYLLAVNPKMLGGHTPGKVS